MSFSRARDRNLRNTTTPNNRRSSRRESPRVRRHLPTSHLSTTHSAAISIISILHFHGCEGQRVLIYSDRLRIDLYTMSGRWTNEYKLKLIQQIPNGTDTSKPLCHCLAMDYSAKTTRFWTEDEQNETASIIIPHNAKAYCLEDGMQCVDRYRSNRTVQ